MPKLKVLVVDQISPVTHYFFNLKILEYLLVSNNVEKVIFYASEELGVPVSHTIMENFPEEYISKYEFIPAERFVWLREKRFFLEIKRFKSIAKLLRSRGVAVLIFTSFENLSFALFRGLMGVKIPIICFVHYNLDGLLSRWEGRINTVLLRAFPYNVLYIVFEKLFETEFTNRLGFPQSQVAVLPHPVISNLDELLNVKSSLNKNSVKRENYKVEIFIPSGSSDMNVVEEILRSEKFKVPGFRVIAKFPKEIHLGWFISKPRYSWEEYLQNILQADVIYVPFTRGIGLRISGPVLDGISLGKIVITNSTPFTEYISREYPHLVFITDSLLNAQIVEKAFEYREKNLDAYRKSYERFLRDHSDEFIQEKLLEFIEARNSQA